MLIFSLIVSSFVSLAFASPKWETTANISNPESIYYDAETNFIFVSNVAGDGMAKDGTGWIQKLSPNGKVIEAKWISGLDAPKGMRAHEGTLWVTNIDTVIAINIQSGKILQKIQIPDAQFLNDIAITKTGEVFVSDTLARTIYKIKNSKYEIFVQGDLTESPNGLLIQENKLIVAAWGLAEKNWSAKVPGNIYALDLTTKKKTLITTEPLGNLDGLELMADGSYLTSDWAAGRVYKVSPQGVVTQIPVKSEQGIADIGYILSTKTLLIPYMNGSRITAYEL